MHEISYIISLVSMVMLFVSAAAWWNALRQPQLQTEAGPLEQGNRENNAAIALFAAFGLGLVAAVLAIFTWIY